MHQRGQHEVFARADVLARDFGEFFGDAFVNFPVGFGLPQRLNRFTQRVNEWVHIGRVQIVFFVPSRSRQNDIGVQTGRGHAEIEHHEQIELALCRRTHGDFLRGDAVRFVAEYRILCAEQIFKEIFVAFAGAA